jgi:hypothetical protein
LSFFDCNDICKDEKIEEKEKIEKAPVEIGV